MQKSIRSSSAAFIKVAGGEASASRATSPICLGPADRVDDCAMTAHQCDGMGERWWAA